MLKLDNGRYMSGEKAKQYVYYGGRKAPTGRGSRHYVREDRVFELLDAVMENFRWSETFSQVVVEVAKEIVSQEYSISSEESKSLFQQLSALKEKQNKLVSLHLDGLVDRQIYERRYFELQKETERISQRLDQVNKNENEKIQKIVQIADTFKNLPLIYKGADKRGKARILRQFLDFVEVDTSGGIRPIVRYPYSVFVDENLFEVSKEKESRIVRHHPALRPLGDKVRTFLRDVA